jgi:drug/metabolite transporter (DMT)-like permease
VGLDPAALGALCALGAALLWAVTSLLVRALAPALNSVSVNAVRSVIGGGLLLTWILLGSGLEPLAGISRGTLGLLAVSIVLAIAVGDTVFFESTRSVGVARAMTVSMTYPLLAALLARAFLGEAIGATTVLGSLLTLAGLALIVAGRRDPAGADDRFWSGIALAALAALAWAVSIILLKPTLAEVDPVTAQALRLPLAGVLLWATPWGWGAVGRLRNGGRRTLTLVLLLGVLSAVSSVMFVASLKYAGVAVAAVLSSTSPMFAIPLGVLVLGERLAARAVLGTVVTVAGIAVLQL